ncbi:hypothetical protein XF35_41450 [Streptomyces platensis subsp. clarensis]|uniref:Uncharacterized protein n=1 Tax=Streptomyces showdoensis TaxID=68268 RepID=A0A2P2GLA5_STREW|nr:hypothetical protein [Streptomyces showdoensis]KKZ72294.1 hypothetical protein VO63_19130 [Streptomyces showdoensis]MCW7991494.1 hypothetical protein [Streptomyces platensis subsp. clarensis]
MKTNLLTAIDTAVSNSMTTAAPTAVPGQGGSVPVSVLLVLGLGGVAWWMFKHGDKNKKLHLLPGFVCLGLGLSLSGTQLGTMVGMLFGNVATMVASFAGNV